MYAFYVPPIGIGDDTTIWWKLHVQVEILYHDKNIIDCKVYAEDEWQNMHISWAYGDPYFSNGINKWEIPTRVGRYRRGPSIYVRLMRR